MENENGSTRIRVGLIRRGFYIGYGLSMWEGRLLGIGLYFGFFQIDIHWGQP